MAEEKGDDLGTLWRESGVKIQVPNRGGGNKRRLVVPKKPGGSTSGTKQTKTPEAQPFVDEKEVVDLELPQQTLEVANPPQTSDATTEPMAPGKRQREEVASPNSALKRRKEEIQQRLAEKGKVPSIADLEACKRVGEHGLELLNELAELMAGELSTRLEGKISYYDLENRRLEGKLFRVQHELGSYRDDSMVSFSEVNRALKKEVEDLRPLKEKLQKAHDEAAALKKKVQRLPEVEKEAEEAKTRATAAEEREKKLDAELQA